MIGSERGVLGWILVTNVSKGSVVGSMDDLL